MQIRTIDKVLKALNEDARTRDNDNLLIALIWYAEISRQGESPDNYPSIDFLKSFSLGKFTSAESIRRCRQKLQEDFPGLRGKSYATRHNADFKEIFNN